MAIIKKVLIVDDDPDILEALQMTFESNGYTTETITNGEETYKLVGEFGPHVIVLDVLLSGNDGRVICKNLKTDTKTKHIPIIMTSAHPDAAKSTIEVGADEFVAKPFDINELIKTVEKYM